MTEPHTINWGNTANRQRFTTTSDKCNDLFMINEQNITEFLQGIDIILY